MHYPWRAMAKHEQIFVPTLKLEQTKREGLNAALHNGVVGKAEFGIKDGKLGVLFTRVR